MDNQTEKTTNPEIQSPQPENVVFKNPETTAIPEEYLTDEDLYPAQTNGGNIPSQLKKKIPLIAIILIAVIVFILLIIVISKLFGKNQSTTNEKVKLSFWGVYQSEAVISEVIKDFTKLYPNIQVEYTQMDGKDNYRERVLERTRNGTGPDIFRFHNTWVSSLKELFAPAPNTIFTAEDFEEIYYPVMVKDLVLDNKVIAVPFNLDGLVLLYNDSILKNVGISQPPLDWETLIEDSKLVTVKDEQDQIVTAGIALGAAENISHFSDIIGLMFLQNGVDIKNLTDNTNAETVLQTYINFVLSSESVWSENYQDSINAFASEQVAMIFAPVWEIEVIKHLNPDLPLKVASVPQIRGGNQKSIANYWADGVSRGSKYQREAWEFLKFLSQKEQQARLFELEAKTGRMFGNVYPRKDMAELLLDNQYLSPMVKDANILDSLPFISRTYDNGINDGIIDQYLKDTVNSLLLGTSSSEAIRNLDLGVKQITEQYSY